MSVSLREVLNSGKFVISAEVGPPKGTNIEKMLHHIDLLKIKLMRSTLPTTKALLCAIHPL